MYETILNRKDLEFIIMSFDLAEYRDEPEYTEEMIEGLLEECHD